jgi:hypothetical protein
MKMPLHWHRSNLVNVRATAESLREEALRATKKADEVAHSADILELQITRAEKEGKDGFDSDRYKPLLD